MGFNTDRCLEEFTALRRTPPAAVFGMRYPYLLNTPVRFAIYHATVRRIRGILVWLRRQGVPGIARSTFLVSTETMLGKCR
jgi:hypothetical protein